MSNAVKYLIYGLFARDRYSIHRQTEDGYPMQESVCLLRMLISNTRPVVNMIINVDDWPGPIAGRVVE